MHACSLYTPLPPSTMAEEFASPNSWNGMPPDILPGFIEVPVNDTQELQKVLINIYAITMVTTQHNKTVLTLASHAQQDCSTTVTTFLAYAEVKALIRAAQ
jgi:hypothetical protein